jgi:hypothetical protein
MSYRGSNDTCIGCGPGYDHWRDDIFFIRPDITLCNGLPTYSDDHQLCCQDDGEQYVDAPHNLPGIYGIRCPDTLGDLAKAKSSVAPHVHPVDNINYDT